jgi:hypothetical protein
MKNYQKLFYTHYYVQNKKGEYVESTRRECFAPPAEIQNNPFPQRWFYDAESGIAIRLARSAEGDVLGKRNAADLKAEERRWLRDNQCVGVQGARCSVGCNVCLYHDDCDLAEKQENGKGCKRKCDCCCRFERRILELDRPTSTGGEDTDAYIDIVDTIDVAEIATDSAVLELLLIAIEGLSAEEKALFDATILGHRTVRDYGEEIHVSHQAVTKQKRRLREKLLGLIAPDDLMI